MYYGQSPMMAGGQSPMMAAQPYNNYAAQPYSNYPMQVVGTNNYPMRVVRAAQPVVPVVASPKLTCRFSWCTCCCCWMTMLFVVLVSAFYFEVNPVNWLWPGKMTTGQVSMSYQDSCLDVVDNKDVVQAQLHVVPCDPSAPSANQRWSFSDGRIVHRRSDGQELCVDIPDDDRSTGNHLQLWTCAGVGFPQQAFKYSGNLLMTQDGNMCLKVDDDSKMVQLSNCARADSSQKWSMIALPKSTFLSQLRRPFRNFTMVPAERV